MSHAVGKPQASSPAGNDGPPSTATVYDFICLFTHDLRRKQKRWQDGKLKYHSFNKKVMVYDDRGQFVGDSHWNQEGDLAPGDELSLDRGLALVQVEDCTGEKQQDLTDLLDKRAREVEKRRQIAAAKTRPAPRGSLAGGAQPQQHRPHLPLSSLVQSPGPIGRAAIPAHSPFEARQQRLHQNQPPNADAQPTVAARPPPAKKRRTSASPPSKAGFARNLFGTTLSLSSCPGPELLAARARALRQRMLSQAEASSTPQEDEGLEEQAPMQSSPLFVQDGADATPSRPAKEQRSPLQPVTRYPIASARSVMREAEGLGNRTVEVATDDEDTLQQENAAKRKRKESRKQERQTAAVDLTTQDADLEAKRIMPDRSSKKKRNDEEPPQSRTPRQTDEPTQEIRKQKPTTTRRSPLPDLMIIDEPDKVEEAPRQRKAPKESQHKKREREKVQEPPIPVRREQKAKEPRTTLQMRSRQKRGLLMMREPSPPPAALPALVEEGIDDRVAKTPTPEPSNPPPQQLRSASPEEVIIPSSAPAVENVPEPAVERIPTTPPESSSEDDLLQPSKRRARKRRTYSPPPEPDVREEEPRKKTRRQTTKRTARKDKALEEEEGEDLQPRKRRVAKRTATNEEMGSELEEDEEEAEIPKKQGPRIAKLPRKGIRSREILGYVAQGIETLIPGAFASGSFRLGGPPVPAVGIVAPADSATVGSAPKSLSTLPMEPVAAASSPIEETQAKTTTVNNVASKPALVSSSPMEEKPAEPATGNSASQSITPLSVAPVSAVSSPIEKKPVFSSHAAPEEPAAAPLEEAVTATSCPPEPAQSQAVAAVSQAAKTILTTDEIGTEPVSRRNATLEAPPPVARCNSSSNAVAPATAEANETKLETLSAPEIPLAKVPESTIALVSENATSSNFEEKQDVILQAPMSVPTEMLPASESTSSGSETNQAGKPRIANPASRGKKAARREDAAGLAPQVMVPLEPVQPVARMISTRPGRGRIAGAGPLALGPVAAPAPAPAPLPLPPAAGMPVVVAKKAASMPGFTSASGGTWSRHAHDLLGTSRPERGR